MSGANTIIDLRVNIEMRSLKPSNTSAGSTTKLICPFTESQTNWKIFTRQKETLARETRLIQKKDLDSSPKTFTQRIRQAQVVQDKQWEVDYKCQVNRMPRRLQDITKWIWPTRKLARWDQILSSRDSLRRKRPSCKISLSRVWSVKEVLERSSWFRNKILRASLPWNLWEKMLFWIMTKLNQPCWKKTSFKRPTIHSSLVWNTYSKLSKRFSSSWSSLEVVSCSCTWERPDNSPKRELSFIHWQWQWPWDICISKRSYTEI